MCFEIVGSPFYENYQVYITVVLPQKADHCFTSRLSKSASFAPSTFSLDSFMTDSRAASWPANSAQSLARTNSQGFGHSSRGSVSGFGSSGCTLARSSLAGSEPRPDPNDPSRRGYIRPRPVSRTANMPPFPLEKWPAPARTQEEVLALNDQLRKHPGLAHTLYRQGSQGPVARLQKDGQVFQSWEHTAGAPNPAEKELLRKHRGSQYVEAQKMETKSEKVRQCQPPAPVVEPKADLTSGVGTRASGSPSLTAPNRAHSMHGAVNSDVDWSI